MREGHCVRCGDPDYWVKDCNLAPYINRLADAMAKKVTITALEEKELDEDRAKRLERQLKEMEREPMTKEDVWNFNKYWK
jgi:hypothetical protein